MLKMIQYPVDEDCDGFVDVVTIATTEAVRPSTTLANTMNLGIVAV